MRQLEECSVEKYVYNVYIRSSVVYYYCTEGNFGRGKFGESCEEEQLEKKFGKNWVSHLPQL